MHVPRDCICIEIKIAWNIFLEKSFPRDCTCIEETIAWNFGSIKNIFLVLSKGSTATNLHMKAKGGDSVSVGVRGAYPKRPNWKADLN